MHEYGLERPAAKTRTGWLSRAAVSPRTRRRPKLIRRARTSSLNLALQGGGAHGAFTWGVLDRLLEAERFRYEGISGTSAGAINGVVLASGWLAGGAAGARANLAELWREVAEIACPLHRSGLPHAALDATTQLLSPYQLNPLDINPLRDLLEHLVDFERLRRDRSLKLFIAATTLRTGTLRIFENRELSADAVLASTCLPWLHQAVEIEGEAYWDGGYVSNPPLLSVVERCRARDLLLVRINSSERSALPRSAGEIRNRVGEIMFDQPLERELALLEARRGALTAFTPAQRRVARHRLHVIDGGGVLSALDPSTKLVPDWTTLQLLHDLGRAAAADWLEGVPAPALRNAAATRGRPANCNCDRIEGNTKECGMAETNHTTGGAEPARWGVSRRDFVKGAGASAAGTALLESGLAQAALDSSGAVNVNEVLGPGAVLVSLSVDGRNVSVR